MFGEKETHLRPHSRSSIKTLDMFNNYPNWKAKLRENCFKRVREDRTRLLWSLRLGDSQDHFLPPQNIIQSTFRDIVSNELNRIKGSTLNEDVDCSTKSEASDDAIWEYDGLHSAYQGDCEDLLLEMQRIFYEDLRKEESIKESEVPIQTWDDEEDEYLSQAVYKQMQLNSEEVVWCPVCKQGELQESHHFIYCTLCQLKLDRGDEMMTLDMLRTRLAEVHTEHLDRGCRLRPGFYIESRFELTALYIKCQGCDTFEIVA